MTEINRQRTSTEEFKQKISEANKRRYEDVEVRKRHSAKVRKAWSDTELRKHHGEYIRQYFQTHKKDGSYMFKPCRLEHNGIVKDFESLKALKQYLSDRYGYEPGYHELKRLLQQGQQRIPFKPYHKNKYAHISGLIVYFIE